MCHSGVSVYQYGLCFKLSRC